MTLETQRGFSEDGDSQSATFHHSLSIPKTLLAPSCPTDHSFINSKLSSQAFEAVLAFFHSLTVPASLVPNFQCP